MKRNAGRIAQKNPINNPVRNAEGLFNVTSQTFQNSMVVFYVSKEEILSICEEKNMEERVAATRTIPNTRKSHYFQSVPGEPNKILTKTTAFSSHPKVVRISI